MKGARHNQFRVPSWQHPASANPVQIGGYSQVIGMIMAHRA
jgi:hypothetical protein